MRYRVLILCFVITLLVSFSAHANEIVQLEDCLLSFLTAADEDFPISYQEMPAGGWYLGTLKYGKYNGYGLWIFPASVDSKGGFTFGKFWDGELWGECTTYFSDGSYLSGVYGVGNREGDFLYVTAEGVKYCYTYRTNKLISSQAIGTTEPLFIRAFDNGSSFGYITQTADGTPVDGHGILCNGSSDLYIGGLNAEGMSQGMGVIASNGATNGAGQSLGYIAFWDVKIQERLPGAVASSEVTEAPVTESHTKFKERAAATYPPATTPTPAATTPASTEEPVDSTVP